ncbi:Uncharacterized protein AC517_3935 [Pseudomonas syringae pv. syringae]|nr:Uncharacterized protein AC517_3935 [Pseudomonas syringae pv. syringae]
MRKLIGAGVELYVAQLFSGENQRRCVRRGAYLGFDQAVQAGFTGEVCSCGVPLAQNMLLLTVAQQRQFAKRRLCVMRQRLQDLLEMRRQLRHVLLAERLAGVAEAQRQGFAEIDHQGQRIMRLLLRTQAAEHQPRRRSLLQGFGHRVVFEHQNGVEQCLASAAGQTLNLVQRRVFMLAQGDVLRLDLLHPLRHPLLGTRAGDHRQGIDEQPELLLDTRQISRTPGHGCAEGDAGLPRIALQHQQPGRLHQRIEGHALLTGKLAQLTGILGVDQVQVITVPLAVLRRLEGLNQPRGLIESGELIGPETLAEPGILALQPFDVIAIAADLPRLCLAAIALQHFTEQARAAPAIHEDMMAGVNQLMAPLAGAQYGQAQQRPVGQIETLPAVGIGPLVDPAGRLRPGIQLDKRHAHITQDHLQRWLQMADESTAQHLMGIQRGLPGGAETRHVQAADLNAHLIDVIARLLLEQGVEQHALLHRCQRVEVFDLPGRYRQTA